MYVKLHRSSLKKLLSAAELAFPLFYPYLAVIK